MTPDEIAQQITLFYGPPMTAIADCMRSFIIPADGHDFVIADYSNIEGRGLAWLAGEEGKLNAFRAFDAGAGPDLYLVTAAAIFGVPVETLTKKSPERQPGKTCIAQGQLVLTHIGLVPIEQVTTLHKVWDGVQWVSHGGAVCKGLQKVIEYDGLIATEDHIVFTEAGQTLSFGACARQQIRIAQTGLGGVALRYGRDNFCGNFVEREARQTWAQSSVSVFTGAMLRLFHRKMDKLRQSFVGKNQGLPVLQSNYSPALQLASGPDAGRVFSVHEPATPAMGELRRPWGHFRFRFCSTRSAVDYRESSATREGYPEDRNRSDKQQYWLCPRELTIHDKGREPEQPPYYSIFGSKRGSSAKFRRNTSVSEALSRCSVRRLHSPQANVLPDGCRDKGQILPPPFLQAERVVWDILSAGPRNRFTVSDRLVHNCELAFGFQGSVGAYRKMESNAPGAVKFPDKEVDAFKTAWRKRYPNIVSYWKDVEDAAIAAVREPGMVREAGAPGRQVKFRKSGSFLWLQLPSKRCLCYPYPELQPGYFAKNVFESENDGVSEVRKIRKSEVSDYKSLGWDTWSKDQLWFMSADPVTKIWGKTTTYGGSLVENITQAVCRDILVEAMKRLSKRGYDIAFTVHDEIVTEVPEGWGSLDEMIAIMCELPSWAAGFPIVAEGYRAKRYRKG